jgi:hypothetical protein
MVGKMHGFCVEIDEPKIVKKILRTLFDAYSEKVSVIEEFIDYKTYTKYNLVGTLTSFEMRKPHLIMEQRHKIL